MANPYPALFTTSYPATRENGSITFTDPANQPGGGGGGQVNSVTAGDSSITVAGTVTDPTVAVAALGVTSAKIAATAVTQSKIANGAVGVAQMTSGAATSGQLATADGAGNVAYHDPATVASVTAADTSIVVAGTATAPTIATGTLDVIATDHPPAANWSNNSKKITSLANGASAQDAAAFGQIPTALPPNGTAGGGLSGTYPNPTVAQVQGVAVSGTAPSANQVLTASDATHASWQAASGASPLTTKGDIFGHSTVDARIPVGADGTVLTADSAQTLGVKWAAGGGGSATKQVQLLFGAPGSAGNGYAALLSTANIRALIPAFVKDVDGFWYGIMRVPQDYSSTPKIILSLAANATTGVTSVIVATVVVANGAGYDAAMTAETVQDISMPGTAYQRTDATFTLSTTPAAGSDLVWYIEHNGTRTQDTLAVDTLLPNAVFQYST